MFKSEIVNRWIVLQQGENHSAIDEEPEKQYLRGQTSAARHRRPDRQHVALDQGGHTKITGPSAG
jgi:hypothetical protein